MLDHIGYSVTDIDKSKRFYAAALAPLSVSLIMEVTAEQTGKDAHVGFGEEGKPYFWIGTGGVRAGLGRKQHRGGLPRACVTRAGSVDARDET